ncbi:MAG: hypothetical protein ACP5TY_00005 [Thermodesulforhabdaceae bacterium]
MLQIISGKFYNNDGHIVETPVQAVLFSKASIFDSVDLGHVHLEQIERNYDDVNTYLISYKHKREITNSKFNLIKAGDQVVIQQFKNISTFVLSAWFDSDVYQLRFLTSNNSITSKNEYPASYVELFFDDKRNISKEEIEQFKKFFSKLIKLKRDTYKNVIKSISYYIRALMLTAYNINEAYVTLVYSLEHLSSKYNAYDPIWTNYDDKVRKKLDLLLEGYDKADEIKSVLLESVHLKLKQGYIDFILDNIDKYSMFDASNTHGLKMKFSDLKVLLKDSYYTRSKFVHTLKEINKELFIPEIRKADAPLIWDGNCIKPKLSFAAMAKIARDVIINFVFKQPEVDFEQYNYSEDEPNTYNLPYVFEPTIENGRYLNKENEGWRVNSFLNNLMAVLWDGDNTRLYNMTDVIKTYNQTINNVNNECKRQMVFITKIFYTCVINEEFTDREEIKNIFRFVNLLDECTILGLLSKTLLDEEWPWGIEIIDKVVSEYISNRYKKFGIRCNVLYDIALFTKLANKYLLSGNVIKAKAWFETAYLDCSTNVEIQKVLLEHINEVKEFDVGILFNYKKLDEKNDKPIETVMEDNDKEL